MPQSRRLFVRWKYFAYEVISIRTQNEILCLCWLVQRNEQTIPVELLVRFINSPWNLSVCLEYSSKKISLEMNMKTDAWCCIESRGIFGNIHRINRFRDRNIHCQRVQNRAKPMAHHYSNNSVVLIFGVSKSQFPTGRNIKLPTNDPRERKITSATVWHEVITTFRVNSN